MTTREKILHRELVSAIRVFDQTGKMPYTSECFKKAIADFEATPEDVVIPREVVELIASNRRALEISGGLNGNRFVAAFCSLGRMTDLASGETPQLALNALAEKLKEGE